MLDDLKKIIREDMNEFSILEAAAAKMMADDSDIRDAFLSKLDKKTVGAGAENDPNLDKLIDMIPECDDGEELTDAEIDDLIENYIPMIR